MPLRLATKADIPIMATVWAAAFGQSDRLFDFMFPNKKEYPQYYEQAAREALWPSYYDYSKVMMVSYEISKGDEEDQSNETTALLAKSKSKDGQREIITGMAEWERIGKGWEQVNGVWGWWDPRLLIAPMLKKYYAFRRRIFPNKAARQPTADEPNPISVWNFVPMMMPLCEHLFKAPHRASRWSLEILCVHPDYHGKGFGKELVAHGLAMAKHDPEGDLPVCVIAAEGKETFYQKNGFGEVEGWTSQEGGMANPLKRNGIDEGGALLWTK